MKIHIVVFWVNVVLYMASRVSKKHIAFSFMLLVVVATWQPCQLVRQ
jgi:hypothetical protein